MVKSKDKPQVSDVRPVPRHQNEAHLLLTISPVTSSLRRLAPSGWAELSAMVD